MGSGDHRAGVRGFGPAGSTQGDGRSAVTHFITGIGATALSLILASVFHLGGTGPQGKAGPAGKTVIASQVLADTPLGVCAYFGPDRTGRTRLQLTSPVRQGNGVACAKGVYVSVVPGR
jgi:hypothetical protein